jgi:2'-5' RNA ligase
MTPERQTALIIKVPAAEPVVGAHRSRLDSNAALGIPAHITVLAPFVPVPALTSAEMSRLQRLFAGVRAFDFRLSHTSWFGTAVLWLAPEDPAPFRELTALVFASYPAYPPFAGQFSDVVPHLTVGHDCPIEEMQLAERTVARYLPIDARASAVTLVAESEAPGQWETVATFSLDSGEEGPS